MEGEVAGGAEPIAFCGRAQNLSSNQHETWGGDSTLGYMVFKPHV